MSKSCLANLSPEGSLPSLSGNMTGSAPLSSERWQFQRRTFPSRVDNDLILFACSVGSPSVAAPSEIFITMGGYDDGCSLIQSSSQSLASLKAETIGVLEFATGSNQTGNSNSDSTSFPSGSLIFSVLFTILRGFSASFDIGTIALSPRSDWAVSGFRPYPITPMS